MTTRIRALDSAVAKTLSAGVAITTLPQALRALLHNSIDAQSRTITVNLDINAMMLTVTDDGTGIHPDDLPFVMVGGHTSKEKDSATCGFRGQDLCAIAAVANVALVSKCDDYNAPFYTRWHNGKTVVQARKLDQEKDSDQKMIMGGSGTRVRVQQLFHNMPARLEQLRKVSSAKLLNQVRGVFLECMVINPRLRITAYSETSGGAQRNLITKVTGSKDVGLSWSRALNDIFGLSVEKNTLFSKMSYKGVKISCMMGTIPVLSKKYQLVYVNGTSLKDEAFEQFVNQSLAEVGFGKVEGEGQVTVSSSDTSPRKGKNSTKLATTMGTSFGKFPLFIMNFEGKRFRTGHDEVMLNDDDDVKTLTSLWIYTFLKNNGLQSRKPHAEVITPDTTEANKPTCRAASALAVTTKMRLGALREKELNGMINFDKHENKVQLRTTRTADPGTIEHLIKRPKLIQSHELDHACLPSHESSEMTLEQLHEANIKRDLLSYCSVVSQVDTKFILLKSDPPDTSLYLIDQHACDERIQVEALVKRFHDDAASSSTGLAMPLDGTPLVLKVNQNTRELLHQYTEQLHRWGIRYHVADESQKIVRITHLPEIMHVKVDGDNTFIGNCIIQYLHDLENNVKIKSFPRDWWLSVQAMPHILVQLINSKACRSAIMFGDTLSRTECELLVRDLAKCKQPFQCAHGRPSIVPLCNLAEQLRK